MWSDHAYQQGMLASGWLGLIVGTIGAVILAGGLAPAGRKGSSLLPRIAFVVAGSVLGAAGSTGIFAILAALDDRKEADSAGYASIAYEVERHTSLKPLAERLLSDGRLTFGEWREFNQASRNADDDREKRDAVSRIKAAPGR